LLTARNATRVSAGLSEAASASSFVRKLARVSGERGAENAPSPNHR